MANKRKCPACKSYNKVEDGKLINNRLFCNEDCIVDYAIKNKPKGAEIQRKEIKRQTAKRKRELKPRTYWFDIFQALVNQWVVHVRDKDKPCCTCGTSNPNIKYDAGHRIHAGRGGADRRRFILINIHKQCSVNCNQHGGGMPLEYDQFLVREYGQEKLDWLKCESNHPTLKELFPHVDDIRAESSKYRKLLTEAGIKPCR